MRLTWVVWCCSQDVSHFCGNLKAWLDLVDLFLIYLTNLVPTIGRGLSSSSGAVWVSSWLEGRLPRAYAIYEKGWQHHNIFYNLASEFTHHWFCNILLVTQISIIPCEGELYKRVNNRRWRSLAAILDTIITSFFYSCLSILLTNQCPSLVFLPDFEYLTDIFPLFFLTILISSYSLYHLLQCIPLHRNYFLEDYQWSLPAKLLVWLFLRHIQHLTMFGVTNHPLMKSLIL